MVSWTWFIARLAVLLAALVATIAATLEALEVDVSDCFAFFVSAPLENESEEEDDFPIKDNLGNFGHCGILCDNLSFAERVASEIRLLALCVMSPAHLPADAFI